MEPTHWSQLPNACDDLPWHRNRGMKKLIFYSSILFIGQFLNGYDGTVVGGLLALPAWHTDLGSPTASDIGLLNAIQFVFGFLMGPVNSFIVDRYGRRWPIRWYAVSILIGTVLGCCAGISGESGGRQGYWLFFAAKCIIGTGLTSFLQTAQILMQEISHPRYRARVAALWDTNWILGNVVASWLTFGTSHLSSSWSWRIPFFVQFAPAIYILVASFMVPETPRWLMGQGRHEECRQFYTDYHGNGNSNDALAVFEYEETKATIEAEQQADIASWRQILRVPSNCRRFGLVALVSFMPQMNGSNIISYYYSVVLGLAGIEGPAKLTGIGAGLNMLGFVAQMCGVISIKYWARRKMVLTVWPILMILMGCMAGAGYAFRNGSNPAAGYAAVVMVWLFQMPAQYIAPLFYSYPAEVLNFSIRGQGMAVWNTVNQAWGAYGSYVNSIALSAIGWRYYCVYIPILALQWILAYFFMVETKNLTLEEIDRAFDGVVRVQPAEIVASVSLSGKAEEAISEEPPK